MLCRVPLSSLCINSPTKEQVHRPGTTLAVLHGQKQLICAKKIFQKVQKQQSYSLFIYFISSVLWTVPSRNHESHPRQPRIHTVFSDPTSQTSNYFGLLLLQQLAWAA